MKSFVLSSITCAVLAFSALPHESSAAVLAFDQGSNYSSATWLDGADDDSGFGDWIISPSGTSATAIGSSTGAGGGADIGTSFTLTANGSGSATAGRQFQGTLANGQSFSVDVVVNFRSGFKGVSLKSGNTDVAMFNIGGDNYQFRALGEVSSSNISGLSGATGNWDYSNNSIFTFKATVSGNDLLVDVTRTGALSASYSTVITGGGSAGIDNFSFFSISSGGGSENNIYFNNLSLVPEPSGLLLMGLGLAPLLLRRRRAARD